MAKSLLEKWKFKLKPRVFSVTLLLSLSCNSETVLEKGEGGYTLNFVPDQRIELYHCIIALDPISSNWLHSNIWKHSGHLFTFFYSEDVRLGQLMVDLLHLSSCSAPPPISIYIMSRAPTFDQETLVGKYVGICLHHTPFQHYHCQTNQGADQCSEVYGWQ